MTYTTSLAVPDPKISVTTFVSKRPTMSQLRAPSTISRSQQGLQPLHELHRSSFVATDVVRYVTRYSANCGRLHAEAVESALRRPAAHPGDVASISRRSAVIRSCDEPERDAEPAADAESARAAR